MKKLLFTDLDGTLLDLETYSAEQAKASIGRLKKAEVSIIFCSSKTWKEQEFYLNGLGLEEPAIVENGSGIFLPAGTNLTFPGFEKDTAELHRHQAVILGKPYGDVLSSVEEVSKMFAMDLKYYANRSIEEISAITGLDLEAAQLAKTRDFSETLFNADVQSEMFLNFEKELRHRGLQCVSGSKYVTITGSHSDKGRAVKILIQAYESIFDKVISFGIGDSRNDNEMLEAVDFPYMVKKPDDSWTPIQVINLAKVNAVGPAGWNIVAAEILAE